MIRSRRLAYAAMCVTAMLTTSACGGASHASDAVQVSLIAPMDGSTVDVSRVFVTGTVQPHSAKVIVRGRRTDVHNGRFGVWLSVRRGHSRIRVSASEHGRVPYTTELTVISHPTPTHKHAPTGRETTLTSSARRAALSKSFEAAPLPGSTWTPTNRREFIAACVRQGASSSFCECALHYYMHAGSPSQIAVDVRAAAMQVGARRTYLKLVGRLLVHCA